MSKTSRLRFLALAAGVILLPAGCAKKDTLTPLDPTRYPYPVQVRTEYQIGETRLTTVAYQARHPGMTFFNMHDDENTAVEAGVQFIRKYGGRLIQLKHTGKRLVEFRLQGKTYRFDPNRMFTDRGARDTLQRYSRADEAAVAALRRLADEILTRCGLDRGPWIITLHNNTERNYSALLYLPGNEYENDAEEVFIAPGSDPDDFFYVTDRSVYEAVRKEGFNVVLQNNRTATDDGSLSVLAARIGIPYVNIEAQHGHLVEQFRMLEALRRIIGSP